MKQLIRVSLLYLVFTKIRKLNLKVFLTAYLSQHTVYISSAEFFILSIYNLSQLKNIKFQFNFL